jgi:hypothetical protein
LEIKILSLEKHSKKFVSSATPSLAIVRLNVFPCQSMKYRFNHSNSTINEFFSLFILKSFNDAKLDGDCILAINKSGVQFLDPKSHVSQNEWIVSERFGVELAEFQRSASHPTRSMK